LSPHCLQTAHGLIFVGGGCCGPRLTYPPQRPPVLYAAATPPHFSAESSVIIWRSYHGPFCKPRNQPAAVWGLRHLRACRAMSARRRRFEIFFFSSVLYLAALSRGYSPTSDTRKNVANESRIATRRWRADRRSRAERTCMSPPRSGHEETSPARFDSAAPSTPGLNKAAWPTMSISISVAWDLQERMNSFSPDIETMMKLKGAGRTRAIRRRHKSLRC